MKIYSLERTQYLPVTVDLAWQFFSAPTNLAAITPKWMDFTVTSRVPEKIYAGLIVTYKVRPVLGIPLTWVTEITHVREPLYFVDEQRFGPYRFWHHQHLFRESGMGTEMEDIVHYGLGFGPLGRTINALVVRRRLNEIFDYRKQVLERILAPQLVKAATQVQTPG